MLGRAQARRDGDHKELPIIVALTTGATSYKMKVTDNVLHVTSDQADGTGIVYLPPMIEAIGRVYCIVAPTGATGGDISLYTIEAGGTDTYDLDADGDAIVLYSTGAEWLALANSIA